MQLSTSIDHGRAGRVRDEDAFDVDAVAKWLSDHAGIDGTPVVRQFPRYFHGQTHNEAYAEFGDGARYFEGRCLALIDA